MIRSALIVEDLPDTLHWLDAALHSAFPGIQVTGAASVAQAIEQLKGGNPDLALVDLGLPDGDGTQIIRHLNRNAPQTLCVVSTIFDDDRHLFAALQAGAQGYILKDQTQGMLVNMLQGISEGQPPLSPAIARRLLGHFHPNAETQEAAASPLSARETDVLRLIAKGYSTSRCAELLGISSHTAAGYIKEIYRKLNIGSRAEATLEATRLGLIHPQLR